MSLLDRAKLPPTPRCRGHALGLRQPTSDGTAVTAPLSIAAEDFLQTCVCSALHLHVLLLLPGENGRWSSVDSIASQLGVAVEPVGRALEDLGRRNIADVRVGSDLLYRCAPVRTELSAIIEEVRAAYYADPAVVERVVAPSRSWSAARAFADAFRVRGTHVDG